MTRKSKQTGGHKPLTHYERTKKFASSEYGTTTARLSSDSQLPFGHCALTLNEMEDPVATPSGHVYSKETILQYLLTKTVELRQAQEAQQVLAKVQESRLQEKQLQEKQEILQDFENSQKVSSTSSKKRTLPIDNEQQEKQKQRYESNSISKTSFWLAEFQPQHSLSTIPNDPLPKRPSSPCSGQPLRRKDLKELIIQRENNNTNKGGKVICALSGKTISMQPVVALPSGHVILQECYHDLIKPTMVNPFTSKPIKEHQVLVLQKGTSGFASSGYVTAKKYKPTLT